MAEVVPHCVGLTGPQFKRTAALQGDFVFHGPRRFFLKQRASKQNSWGFGPSFHGSDATAVANTLPKYTSGSSPRLTLDP